MDSKISKKERAGVGISKQSTIHVRTGDIEEEYHFMKVLGAGAFGEVRLAQHISSHASNPNNGGALRAIKCIPRRELESSKKRHQMLLNEYSILKQIDNPHIIKIFELWKDDVYYYIITEYLEGGELYKTISKRERFTEKDWAMLIKQILLALNYCHKGGIVHRDLKPENILFESNTNDSNVKLVDFGFAEIYNPDKGMKDVLGTPLFIAPEILSEKKYNNAVDIWSLGVITYFLICGYPAFDGSTREELFKSIKSGKYSFPGKIWTLVSEEWKEFISKWLTVDQKKRPSAEKLLDEKWITKSPSSQIDEEVVISSLNNLSDYARHNKFQQGVVHFLTYKCAEKDEIIKLTKVFEEIDENNDGKLNVEEIGKYIKKVMGTINYTEIKEIFDQIDVDKSGYIDYSEFLSATINKKTLLRKNELMTIFDQIDKDGSGNISKNELRKAFQTKGTK